MCAFFIYCAHQRQRRNFIMDELNQVQTTSVEEPSNEVENLFDGLNFEESSNESTPTEDENSNVETQDSSEEAIESANESKPFSLHVKYNGEEKDLGEEEARTLAQKGMNYDNIYEPLQRLASMHNIPVGEYLNKLFDTETEISVGEEMDSLREQYPSTPEEILKELAEKRVMENQNLQQRRFEDETKTKKEALSAEVERQVGIFKKEYPNLEPSGLDPEVYKYVEQGYSLLEAYNKWNKIQDEKNRPAIEAKEKSDKLNEENKKKSLGNITNAGDESGEYNDFFKGMDSI